MFILSTRTHQDGNDLCQKGTSRLSARCIGASTVSDQCSAWKYLNCEFALAKDARNAASSDQRWRIFFETSTIIPPRTPRCEWLVLAGQFEKLGDRFQPQETHAQGDRVSACLFERDFSGSADLLQSCQSDWPYRSESRKVELLSTSRSSARVRGKTWSTPGSVRCRPESPSAVGELLLHERPGHARGVRALGVTVR